MNLTKAEALMVIEYFATQAAEDAPATDFHWKSWDKHMWMTRFQISLAVERQIKATDWETLVNHCFDLQSFDRDADAYLYEAGITDDLERAKDSMGYHLKEQVSWAVDNCWNNSGA